MEQTGAVDVSNVQDDLIERIDARTVALAIPHALQLGRMRITERRYAVVTVHTTSGLVGNALMLSRDLPVAAVVRDNLAPVLTGTPADLIGAAWRAGFNATFPGGRSSVTARALGLVDIALWDIKGQRAGLPVWRLLGGDDPATSCVIVGGYPTGEPPEAVGERVADYASKGHRLVKVSRPPSPGALHTILTRAAEAGAGQFIVDAGWCWTRATEAAAEIRTWADAAPLAWVEDPIPPEDVDAYVRLVAANAAPIGVGDELGEIHTARRLALHAKVDVLRIDAAAIGGITPAFRLANVADAAGCQVSFHVYPEVHVHLAAALGPGALTESWDGRDNPFDPMATLYEGGPIYSPSLARAPDTPGLGFTLDTDRINAHAID